MSQRILCNWFPNWPIQRLVVDQPELRCQRVVLFRRDARRGQLVAAASPMAIQQGVAVGMPLSEAKSLLRRSTSAAKPAIETSDSWFVFEHDPQVDREALDALCDQLESFSPVVGLEAIDTEQQKRGRQPAALLLDITGLAHLFGDEAQLVDQQMQHIESLGYLPRVAVADTVAAAWGLARFAAGLHFRQYEQPLILPPGDQQFLEALPVAALRLDDTLLDTLHQLGIRTLAQLMQLPRRDLAMRFGQAIHRRLDQLSGKLDEPVQARRRPSAFVAEQLLEHATHHRETMEVVIQRLVAQLCQQLRSEQQGALEWTLRLVCQQREPIEIQVRLFQPTAEVDHVMPLVEMQLEQALSRVTRKSRKRQVRYTTIEVTEIQVVVSSYVLLVQQQRMLFDENPRLDRQSLAHLINRMASRLGTDKVLYPTLQSGAQPEYSYRLKPLVDIRRRRRRKTATARQQSHVMARPLRLFHPPLPLESTSAGRDARGTSKAYDGRPRPSLPQGEDARGTSKTYDGRPRPLPPQGEDARGTSKAYDGRPRPSPPQGEDARGTSKTYDGRPRPLPPQGEDARGTSKAYDGRPRPSPPQGEDARGTPSACDRCRQPPEWLRLKRESETTLPFLKFDAQRKPQQIVSSWGPERIETGWWRGRTVCRDYWRVEIESGQQFWIFRSLRTGQWWLQGEF